MKRLAVVSAIALVFVLAAVGLSGCGGAGQPEDKKPVAGSPTDFPVTVTDDAGRKVTVEKRPARLVCVAPANTEILYSLGRIGDVVGVTTYDDYPAEVKKIAKIGDFMNPNMEAIAAARPDLILMTAGVQADVIARLEGSGARVLVVDPKSLDGVFKSIEMVARASGDSERGREVVDGMRQDLAAIRKKVASRKPVTCFVEFGWNPLYAAGADTVQHELVTEAGGRNVVKQAGYVSYSVEQLVKDQPEMYLGTDTSVGDPAKLGLRPGYSALECIKRGSVGALSENLVSRPGPRIIQGVEEIARALHPEAFE